MYKNIIFFSGKLNLRAGGPSGYLANLKRGLNLIEDNSINFITNDDRKVREFNVKYFVSKLLTFWIPQKRYRRKCRNKICQIFGVDLDDATIDSSHYKLFVKKLDGCEFATITCHFVKDALFIRNYLKARNKNAKLILMSHSPEAPSLEFYATEKIKNNPDAEDVLRKWQSIEKEAFLSAADILLFPARESIEPYAATLEYFNNFDEQKLKFLPTGCCQLKKENDIEKLREKYNIKTPYVITYIGRHNKIKGYDLLKEVGEKILQQRDDVTFLIGGNVSTDIKPLNHPRWIELGFVNPSDVLSISDCFILPNRQTYFDLVLLEVMSMGVPVFASATGGNKSVYKATNAISLYESLDECVEKVNRYLDLNVDDRNKLKKKTLQAYYDNYTLEIFAKNYVKMIESL